MNKEERKSIYQPWAKVFEQLAIILAELDNYIAGSTIRKQNTREYVDYGLGFVGIIRTLFINIEGMMKDNEAEEINAELVKCFNELIRIQDEMVLRGSSLTDMNSRIPAPVFNVVVERLPNLARKLHKKLVDLRLRFPTLTESSKNINYLNLD